MSTATELRILQEAGERRIHALRVAFAAEVAILVGDVLARLVVREWWRDQLKPRHLLLTYRKD